MNSWLRLAQALGFGLILAASASSAWAQGSASGRVWEPATLGMAVISTVVFGLLGIVLAILGFKLFDALTPVNLEKEISEKQNIAVAIVCAAMLLGICLIIAAAVL